MLYTRRTAPHRTPPHCTTAPRRAMVFPRRCGGRNARGAMQINGARASTVLGGDATGFRALVLIVVEKLELPFA